ncbi:MAG: DUF4198 domain-containing protein [Bacteroidota bacterium]
MLSKEFKGRFHKLLYLFLAFMVLCSHDLYIKMETYFLQPNQEATLSLYNGTFEKSENIISRDRMLDASLVTQGERIAINPDQWKDQDSTITQLTFNTSEAGTYIVGVSTKARNIELTADKFNKYLKHDGVLDMLEYRTNNNLLNRDAVESYQKHVKAIYQVGDIKTDDWKTVLGYPIEFIPQANPYEKYSGDKLEVKLLLDGRPLSNQLVYANHIKGTHTHEDVAISDEQKQDKAHSHEHEHDRKKHSHEHNNVDDEHSHEHQDKKHSHTHEHEHDGKKHSHKHSHEDNKHRLHDDKPKPEEEHTHTSGQQLRTNDQGVVLVNLSEEGIYYLRTIHMVNITDSAELTHQSKWATLTFEVNHKHDASTHTHDDYDHEGEIPVWVFVLVSFLVIGLLFLIFRKKN